MAEALSRLDLVDLREDFRTHLSQDREDFAQVRAALNGVEAEISRWSGAFGLAKWSLGLGVPAILGALLAHVVRHWS